MMLTLVAGVCFFRYSICFCPQNLFFLFFLSFLSYFEGSAASIRAGFLSLALSSLGQAFLAVVFVKWLTYEITLG